MLELRPEDLKVESFVTTPNAAIVMEGAAETLEGEATCYTATSCAATWCAPGCNSQSITNCCSTCPCTQNPTG